MRTYIANPNYADASQSDNWQVTGNLDPAQAISDLTKLSVGSITNDGTHYWAAHVEDISRMMTGYTQLIVGTSGTIGTTGSQANGDHFAYVDNIAGFQSGLTAVVLEGQQLNKAPYSVDATSTDAFQSEWLKVGTVGLIPASTLEAYDASQLFSAYWPSDSPSSATIATHLSMLTGLSSAPIPPTPASVGGTAQPSFYVSASGDPTAAANLLTLLPDFTNGFDVSDVDVGDASTTITLVGFSDSFAIGQTITLALQNTKMGWYAGKVASIGTTVGATHTATFTAGATSAIPVSSTSGLALGMSVSGAGIPDGTLISGIGTGTIDLSQPATSDETSVALTSVSTTLVTDLSTSTPSTVSPYLYPAGASVVAGNVQAFGATLTDEEVRFNNNANSNGYENSFDCTYFTTPYYITAATSDSGRHYGQNLVFPITFKNYRSTPIATFQSMTLVTGSTYTVSVDDASNVYPSQKLTFADHYDWVVDSVDPVANTFVVSGVTGSTAYDSTASYPNGDPKNAIYEADSTINNSASFDLTSPTKSGQGVVTFSTPNSGHLTGFHAVGTLLGCYSLGTNHYIGSSTVGDLEQVVISTIGSRVGTTLATDVQSQIASSFIVNASPSTVVADFVSTGTDAHGNVSHTGGWTPLVNPNDTQPIYTLVVGTGDTQEMVRVIWSGNDPTSAFAHTPTMDGKSNTPAVWTLAPGQSFQYAHSAGEPVCTPNLIFVSASTVGHAKDTPVLGSPDNTTVYTPSTNTTNYEAATALVAYNPSGTLAVTADAYIGNGQPWTPSGDNGEPNISTTLAADSPAFSTSLLMASDDGFPTQYPPILQNGIAYLPPEMGRVAGDVPVGSTQIPFITTGDVPTQTPFFINIGGEIYEVTSIVAQP
jgi:hypothetical protein